MGESARKRQLNTPLLAVVLGLVSAVTLAAANVSVKLGSDILLGRVILSVSAAVIVAPFVFFVEPPDAATIQALIVALPAHYAYQMCLVQAMRRGELSLVFPIMRGLAPLFTALSVMILIGQHLAPLAWAGLIVATASVMAFAWPPRGTGLHRHPDRAALGWAAVTAIGISLYNAADTHGVHAAPAPATFIVWLFLLDWVLVTATALVTRRGMPGQLRAMPWRWGVVAGGMSVISFGAALWAFSLAETAKVSALRETAVVFAALMGGRLLGEGASRRRILAATTLAAGLVAMQFG